MNKENRMSKASLPEFQGGSLEEYVEVLYAHQKTCQKTGKYMEADNAKKRLVKVKEQLQRSRKQGLLGRFEQQKRQVEMAHIEEITDFNKYWDSKMLEYQAQAQKMQAQSIERHEQEVSEFEQQIQRSLAQSKRQSGQIINLRKIEENLAKQQKYVQAHQVQKQIQNLERIQFQKWSHIKANKMKNLMGQLKNKQDNQLNALRQKIQQGFEQQKRIRNIQYEKLIQKYQNFMKQLDNQHHQEVIKFQKNSKLQSTINFSRTSNASRALQSRNI